MSKAELWMAREGIGQYYIQRIWTPAAYINGSLRCFTYFWQTWWIDADGARHDAAKYWYDPRIAGSQEPPASTFSKLLLMLFVAFVWLLRLFLGKK